MVVCIVVVYVRLLFMLVVVRFVCMLVVVRVVIVSAAICKE